MLVPLFLAGALLASQTTVVVAPLAEKKVCKSERSISTRVVKRICKTTGEWDRDSLDARNKLKLGNANRAAPEAFKRPASEYAPAPRR